jgi:hypothetical protein
MGERLATAAMVLSGALALAGLGPGLAGGDEVALFDAPRGAWLATVRADAPLLILEERGGWRRVRVEGWVPAAGGGGAPTGGGAGPSGPPEGGPGPGAAPEKGAAGRVGGAAVRGVLSPAAADVAARPGAGLVVLLVPRLETLEAEHALLGASCRERARAAEERALGLLKEADWAMATIDNYREAMTRHDRLRREAAGAERERLDLLRTCRDQALALFERRALRRTISDADGRFDFEDVPPGAYRAIAAETAGERPRAWVLECPVTGPGPRVLDPRADASTLDLFWGL